MVIIICALALIGIGYFWGWDSNTTAIGNEKIIKAEQVYADVVFTKKFSLVDDKGNIGGFFSMNDDGSVMLSLDRSDDRIVFHMQMEGRL